MIHVSSTKFSTIKTVMKKAQNICTCFDQKDVVVSFDLAIFSKAKQIIWKYPDEFPDTLIQLGGFHITLNFLAVLGNDISARVLKMSWLSPVPMDQEL